MQKYYHQSLFESDLKLDFVQSDPLFSNNLEKRIHYNHRSISNQWLSMKLTTKCRYGIRAVMEIARNYQIRPTKRKDIAQTQEIPDSFLENILIDLKHAGIIASIRGVKGGFVLKQSPDQITAADIFVALQGPLSLVDCIDSPTSCDRVEKCVVRPMWQEMQKAQERVLEGTTIESLVKKEDEKIDRSEK